MVSPSNGSGDNETTDAQISLLRIIFLEIRMGSRIMKSTRSQCKRGVRLTNESTELHPKEDETGSKGDSKSLNCCSNFMLGSASVTIDNAWDSRHFWLGGACGGERCVYNTMRRCLPARFRCSVLSTVWRVMLRRGRWNLLSLMMVECCTSECENCRKSPNARQTQDREE